MNKAPLHIAVENHSQEFTELLLSKGANINSKDINYKNMGLIFLLQQVK